MHFAIVEPKAPLKKEDVVSALREAHRIVFVKGADGVEGLNAISKLLGTSVGPEGTCTRYLYTILGRRHNGLGW